MPDYKTQSAFNRLNEWSGQGLTWKTKNSVCLKAQGDVFNIYNDSTSVGHMLILIC